VDRHARAAKHRIPAMILPINRSLIGDVDVGATPPLDDTAATPIHLVQPQDLVDALTANSSATPLDWLGQRRSVWVVGDPSNAVAWRRAIAGLMAVHEDEIITVEPRRIEPPVLTTVAGERQIAA
jgi:hypothetical protein